jgi:Family of unknown function (DUF6161)
MAEDNTPKKFEFDLGEFGSVITISSPGELKDWVANESRAWEWIKFIRPGTAQSPIQSTLVQHQNFKTSLENLSNDWARTQNSPQNLDGVLKQLGVVFQNYYRKRVIFHSSSPEAAFLSRLREKRGEFAAIAAYAALLKTVTSGNASDPQLIEGFFEAFLFGREIDWTGETQSEIFNNLKKQYEENLTTQTNKAVEIETRNTNLNQAFADTLKQRTDALLKLEIDKKDVLDKLHGEQSTAFEAVIKKHQDNLKAIELAYDQKLALQKPVLYWKAKERYHGRLSVKFGIAALITLVVLAAALGLFIYWVFAHLGPNENPKEWQIGLVLIAIFFSIWIMRILIRIFLSHLHQAGDAAERRTMIHTYLSLAREGSQFTPADKMLILQHIFRSVSDGLVKDDAAPPSPMEFLSRDIK